jgi:hypothetical protein
MYERKRRHNPGLIFDRRRLRAKEKKNLPLGFWGKVLFDNFLFSLPY